jgi:antitoxin HicB
MLRYHVVFESDPDTGQIIAELPDIPGCISIGADEDEAREMVVDAALTWLHHAMLANELLPAPEVLEPGQAFVEIPAMAEMKLYIYLAMRDQGVSQVRLARRLHTDPKAVRRLLNLWHRSEWDHVEMALEALGYQASVTVTPSAHYPAFHGGKVRGDLVHP